MFLPSIPYNSWGYIGKSMDPSIEQKKTAYCYRMYWFFLSMLLYCLQERRGTQMYYSSCCYGKEICIMPSYEPCRLRNIPYYVCTIPKFRTGMFSSPCFKIQKHSKNVMFYALYVSLYAFYNMLYNVSCFLFLLYIQRIYYMYGLRIVSNPCLFWHAKIGDLRLLYGYVKICQFLYLWPFLPLLLLQKIYNCFPYDTSLFLFTCKDKELFNYPIWFACFCYIVTLVWQYKKAFYPLSWKLYNMVVLYIQLYLMQSYILQEKLYTILYVMQIYPVELLQDFCIYLCKNNLPEKLCTCCYLTYTTRCKMLQSWYSMYYITTLPLCYKFYWKKRKIYWMLFYQDLYNILHISGCENLSRSFPSAQKNSLQYLCGKRKMCYSRLLLQIFGKIPQKELLISSRYCTPYNMQVEGGFCYTPFTAFTKVTHYNTKIFLYWQYFMSNTMQSPILQISANIFGCTEEQKVRNCFYSAWKLLLRRSFLLLQALCVYILSTCLLQELLPRKKSYMPMLLYNTHVFKF
uniref:p505_7R n=1 Tax=African swine fever virus TaxID=10497 RepID=A0A6G7KU44_ASF